MKFLNDVEYVITFLLQVSVVDYVVLVFSVPFGVVVVPGVRLISGWRFVPVKTSKWCRRCDDFAAKVCEFVSKLIE